jgi:hypothetical protein
MGGNGKGFGVLARLLCGLIDIMPIIIHAKTP